MKKHYPSSNMIVVHPLRNTEIVTRQPSRDEFDPQNESHKYLQSRKGLRVYQTAPDGRRTLLGRALSYLHTGRILSRDRYKVLLDEPKLDVWSTAATELINPEPSDPDWEPITHFDGHAENRWPYYPTATEKEKDSQLQGFTRNLPQVILGDYGRAFDTNTAKENPLCADMLPSMPESMTWRDKAILVFNERQLMLSEDPTYLGGRRPGPPFDWDTLPRDKVQQRPDPLRVGVQALDHGARVKPL
ncbi:hypothetical protein B0H63DRAFT_564180 [Podospora didyma]|uniref:Uncharacterized protein n=1 Tax=Podospora didyma TaxID=330526 RepID=A0AAE0K5V7_9PEZI|nr:hypothetical protein B0H63DRAFT_564180 [Podospora didyma]